MAKSREISGVETEPPVAVLFAVIGMAGVDAVALSSLTTWLIACDGGRGTDIQSYSDPGAFLAAKPDRADAPTSHLIIVYRRCADMVGQAMSAKQSPDSALNDWLTAAEVILALHRRHRHRSVLVDLAELAQRPGTLRAALESRFAWQAEPEVADVSLRSGSVDMVCTVLAMQMLNGSRKARQLEAELEASALPLGTALTTARPDVAEAFKEYTRLQAQQGTQTNQADLKQAGDGQLSGAAQEKELLLQQLSQVQEDMEFYFEKSKTLDAALQAQQKQTEMQIKTLTHARDAAQSTLDKLRRDHAIACQTMRKEKDALESHFVDLRREHEEFLASKSWKVTEPLRRLRALLIRVSRQGA